MDVVVGQPGPMSDIKICRQVLKIFKPQQSLKCLNSLFCALVLNKSSNFLHHLSKQGGMAAGVVSLMMAIATNDNAKINQ